MANRNLEERKINMIATVEGMHLLPHPSKHGNLDAFPQRINPFVTGGSTQLWPLGTPLCYGDQKFRYAKMGAVAGVPGKLYQSVVPLAGHIDEVPGTAAADATTITFTPNTVTTDDLAANELADGYLLINNETGEGHMYRIKSHPAITGGSAGTLTLYDPIITATVTGTSKATVIHNPYRAVIVHPSPPTAPVVGLCRCAVTAGDYCWLQVWGPAPVLTDGTIVIGQQVRASEDDDGGVAALDFDEAARDDIIIGIVLAVCADTEYSPIFLKIG